MTVAKKQVTATSPPSATSSTASWGCSSTASNTASATTRRRPFPTSLEETSRHKPLDALPAWDVCRPGQVRLEDPPDHRADWSAPVCRHLRCQRPRQLGPDPAREGHTTDPIPARSSSAQARQTARRQGIRLLPPAAMVIPKRYPAPHSPQGS